MRILIADRNAAVCSALTVYLQNMLELDTVCQAADEEELLAQAEAFCPDIVLVDWGVPGPDRTELLASLHALEGRPSLIVLASHFEQERDALAAGADYFACKADPPARLLAAVRLAIADCGAEDPLSMQDNDQ
jgi:DNA-binding NarL/FixJ family response regulator